MTTQRPEMRATEQEHVPATRSGFRQSTAASAEHDGEPDARARLGDKPRYASLWQFLRCDPRAGLRWLLRGGKHAPFFHDPVRWLFGRDLLVSLRSIALYSAFGDELDHRDWMESSLEDLRDEPLEEGGFWFDYVADTGDGQLAMYDIARLLLSDLYVDDAGALSLTAGDAAQRLPRGRFLFMGGDTAYHVADSATLEQRVCAPFAWALADRLAAETGGREPQSLRSGSRDRRYDETDTRYVFGVPGNHDYYDSLIGFNRLLRAPDNPHLPLADFRRRQRASFVALQLPLGYLLLGLDSQSGKLDHRQRELMRTCLNEHRGHGLIVATPEPATVFDTVAPEAALPYAALQLPRPFAASAEQRAFPAAEQLQLDLAGDIHHYARYADPAHPNYAYVVAGGGGAFFHPTQTSHAPRGGASWPPRAAKLYPEPDQSRRVINARLLCPWRIARGGGVFLLGGVLSLVLYLGAAFAPGMHELFVNEWLPRLPVSLATPHTAGWELASPVVQSFDQVLGPDAPSSGRRSELLVEEWLNLALLGLFLGWAALASPGLFRHAAERDEHARPQLTASSYAALCAGALLCLLAMAVTYYTRASQTQLQVPPFAASFLLLSYLSPLPLAMIWVASYLATLQKQAKVRPLTAADSAPRWIAFLFGLGSALFGLLSYGVNSVAAFAADLAALGVVLSLSAGPVILGFAQGARRSLRHKLGYAALGALFGQLQLALPLLLATYGGARELIGSALFAVAIAGGAYRAQCRWSTPWLALGAFVLAGVGSIWLTLMAASLRPVSGFAFGTAFLAGGTFACIWFGFYLTVALGFGAHNNEAGGAARVDYYRHFIRFKLEPQRITGFVVGFDRPAVTLAGDTGDASPALQPRLVERFELSRTPIASQRT